MFVKGKIEFFQKNIGKSLDGEQSAIANKGALCYNAIRKREKWGVDMTGQWHSAPLSELPQVRILGRHSGADPLTLFWSGSGVELDYTGSELWAEFYVSYQEMEPWVTVEVDGAFLTRLPLNPGQNRLCLLRGVAAGKARHIRLLKETQAMSADARHLLQITALQWRDGEFLPLPAPCYRLEFVGDSITSGEGAIGSPETENWNSSIFSVQQHYARETADALGAEFRLISQSGWGVLSGWDNDLRHNLPEYYTRVCGVMRGPEQAAQGAQREQPFAEWQPDAVIVNLGTNDCYAFDSPAWTDPETGEQHQLHRCADGSFDPADTARIQQAVVRFLALLRRCNPQAQLVWAYGMLGHAMQPVLEAGVAQYRAESGDEQVHFVLLPDTQPGAFGAHGHPGAASHRAAADVLTEALRMILA